MSHKKEILHEAKRWISSFPDEFLDKLKNLKPEITTEKAHAYPASLINTFNPVDEKSIDFQCIKPQYAKIYVHIPWCKQKCTYCRYPNKINIPSDNDVSDYFNLIDKEFKLYLQKFELTKFKVDTLYIGGGTPTLLNEAQLEKLIFLIKQHVDVKKDVYIKNTIIETAPSTLTKEKVQILKKHDFNRVSMGVQSFNDDVLAKCKRSSENYHEVKRALSLLADAGIPRTNLDLMTGLPGQTAEIFIDDVLKIISLKPNAISLLDMEIWPGSELYGKEKNNDPNRWKLQILMSAIYHQLMESHGYIPVRPHYYVTKEEIKYPLSRAYLDARVEGFQIGIGPHALSHVGTTVYRNHDIKEYSKIINDDKLPINCGIKLNKTTSTAMKAIRGLCLSNIFPKAVRDCYKDEIALLKKYNLIDESFKLTKNGRLFDSEIMYLLHP